LPRLKELPPLLEPKERQPSEGEERYPEEGNPPEERGGL
jgi:hypothetical protein